MTDPYAKDEEGPNLLDLINANWNHDDKENDTK